MTGITKNKMSMCDPQVGKDTTKASGHLACANRATKGKVANKATKSTKQAHPDNY